MSQKPIFLGDAAKKAALGVALVIAFTASAGDEWRVFVGMEQNQQSQNNRRQTAQQDPFIEVRPNTYGMGVGSDQYGRPVTTEAKDQHSSFMPDPLIREKKDAYGPGVGMDQYGRPTQNKVW